MTRAQAQIQLVKGNKITHRHFSVDEFVQIKDNALIDEKGYKLNKKEFWLLRGTKSFNTDWEIYVSS